MILINLMLSSDFLSMNLLFQSAEEQFYALCKEDELMKDVEKWVEEFLLNQLLYQYSETDLFCLWSKESKEVIAQLIKEDIESQGIASMMEVDKCAYVINRIMHLLKLLQTRLFEYITSDQYDADLAKETGTVIIPTPF